MARVALAQFSGNIDKEKNLEKALRLAYEAARNGAKIICFPELCTTVYMPFENDAYAELEPSLVREARRKWTFYEDRRPELYGAIVKEGPRPE